MQTERLMAQRREGRSLNGIYRNVYTNDPLAGTSNTTANTTVQFHAGVLLSMKEDALPYALDPHTLETLGVWDLDGQINSATFTAHPKVDPSNRDLPCFAYEAKGGGTPDIAYYEIDADGKLKRKSGQSALRGDDPRLRGHRAPCHLPGNPLTVDVERMKQGGQHFQWQPDLPQLFGVLPRHGDAQEVRWFKGPKDGFQGHTLNAYEDHGKLYVDMPVTSGNVFYFFPQADGYVPSPETLRSQMMRWTFDLNATSDEVEPVALTDFPCEFPAATSASPGSAIDMASRWRSTVTAI